MRKKVRTFLILLMTLLISIYVSSCSLNNSTVVEIKQDDLLSSINQKTIHFIHWSYFPREIFDEYSSHRPDIIIDFEQFPEDQYAQVQLTRMSSGGNVDIMGVLDNYYTDFIDNGYLEELTDEKFIYYYNDRVTDELKKLYGDGKIFAIAYRSWVLGMWYNKTVFKKLDMKIPSNYKEFLDTCEKLKRSGVSPMILGCRDDWAGSHAFFLRLGKIIHEDPYWLQKLKTGKARWTDPKVKEIFYNVEEFLNSGYLHKDSINLTYHQAFSWFVEGRAAMCISPDWFLGLLKSSSDKPDELGVFPIPYNDPGQPQGIYGNQTGLLTGIFSGSQEKDEAKEFLDFLSWSKTAQIYSEAAMAISNVKTTNSYHLNYFSEWQVLRNDSFILDPVVNQLDPEVQNQFYKATKKLMLKTDSVDNILEQLQVFLDSDK